ncbi:hypothetical protein AAFF_G00406070 [Aldrovandia affinis]|uniref:Uncharacterized protein n=1 Tax=Aldrovandia affinis TaxID=143900 RepID=A0AAD7SCM6_9TELE|nr:hypothetical protein AAFF_G00406070 [Aldrovandia affinis]
MSLCVSLAIKQDREGALQEADIINHLSLEKLVNQNKCHCKIKAIKSELAWLLKTVAKDYDIISKRVQEDTSEQRKQEEKDRRDRAERVPGSRGEMEKKKRESERLQREGRRTRG